MATVGVKGLISVVCCDDAFEIHCIIPSFSDLMSCSSVHQLCMTTLQVVACEKNGDEYYRSLVAVVSNIWTRLKYII